MNPNLNHEVRMNYAKAMLKLAKDEIKKYGTQFMAPGEDVYDSAVQYGGSIRPKLTREEVLEAEKE